MGQNQSTPTPLSLILTHFQDYRRAASVFGLHVKKSVLRTLCEVEWTSFQVEWPPQGTFDLTLIYKVHDIVFSRHEDQIPYIGAWRTLIENPPDWLKLLLPLSPCLPKVQALPLKGSPSEAQNKNLDGTKRLPPLSPAPEEEEETYRPPPYSSRSKNTSQDASDQEASPSQDTSLSPSHTRSGTPFHPPPTALPLRPGPPLQGEVRPFMTYVPFSTSDLYNWKLQNPSFSEKPQTLISLLETIFVTHQPTWDDCQQLLQVLFTTEERDKIRREAQKLVMGPNGQPTVDPAVLEEVFPSSHPENWDPNTPHGRQSLTLFRQTLLGGLRAAARRPTNMSKVTEVIQGAGESPSAFLERLMEAYRTFTPIDPEAPENRRALNLAFVSQAAPDIRKKLQKLDGFEGKKFI
ncbi:uncharacterized protein LOC122199149 [Panthera leo]|uniref:uncharacterized protein LOC122199149 n=1 Tax=Panthera leo TaxID=9689 RepID=UPI001C6A6117|nr:uncharacterized protein LOC122199149 [Panthera leo]